MDLNFEYQPFFAFNVINKKFMTESPAVTTGDINFNFSFLMVFTDWVSRPDLEEPQFLRHLSQPVINHSVRVSRGQFFSEETKLDVEEELMDCFHVDEDYRMRALVEYSWRKALATIMSNPSCYSVLNLDIYVLMDHRHILIDFPDASIEGAEVDEYSGRCNLGAEVDEYSGRCNLEMMGCCSFGLEELFSGGDDGGDICEQE